MAIGQSTMTLYAKREDLPDRKGYGAELRVDGIPYSVNTWRESIGMTAVNLFISINS
nr:MAG TPA: ATP-binding sugar transporter [Caudoviricetes sp.]